MPSRLQNLALAALASLVLAGCCCCCATRPETVDRPTYTPTYAELVANHNQRVKGIKSFWARAVVEVRWVDENGNRRFEQGDGHLILDLPLNSSLTLGKLSVTKLGAGSNDTYYWLFDKLDGSKVYLGRQDGKPLDVPHTRSQRSSPLLVHPSDIPALLGILPIPDLPPGIPEPQVRWEDTSWVVDPPGTSLRYYYHPIHYQVLHVALLNKDGEPILVSKLEKPERIEMVDMLLGPYINRRIAVTTPGQPGSMTLFLEDMTNDPDRVNKLNFDLNFQMEQFKPDTVIAIESK